MKKLTKVLLLVFLGVVMISGTAYAISGQCSGCHTMHASQNGTTWGDGPLDYLLLYTCINCHSGPADTAQTGDGAPIVFANTGTPSGQGNSYTLAGGNFYWVATSGAGLDSYGHNVAGIAGPDGSIVTDGGLRPPGWDPAATPGAITGDGQVNAGNATWTIQLTCAGQYGCHGNHTGSTQDEGIQGSHHSNTGGTSTRALNPTTVGGSFRFLGGINGLEDTDWNWAETTSAHNEYYGVNGNAAYANKRTINYSCAQCHGLFHSDIGGPSSPWTRHPTDFSLGSATGAEYSRYNPDVGGGGNTYSLEAPIARDSVATDPSSSITVATSIVMCLSCHRAHGSDQPDILRWRYAGIQAGSGTTDTGCFTCHTCKNADCP